MKPLIYSSFAIAFSVMAVSCQKPQKAPNAEVLAEVKSLWDQQICINGKGGEEHRFSGGQRVELTYQGGIGKELVVRGGMPQVEWYRGPAEKMKLQMWLLKEDVEVVYGLLGNDGKLESEKRVKLLLDQGKERVYGGLVYQLLKSPVALETANSQDFRAHAKWPVNAPLVDTSVPAFRTSESIHGIEQVVQRPSYYHGVLPSLSVTPDVAKNLEWQGMSKYPFEDIGKRFLVSARVSGVLMPDRVGKYSIRWQCNLPSKIKVGSVGGQVCPAGSHEMQVDVVDGVAVPIEIYFNNTKEIPQVECRLWWKSSEQTEYQAVPMRAYGHTVEPEREAALVKATQGHQGRKPASGVVVDDSALPVECRSEKKEDSTYIAAVTAYWKSYLYGKKHQGDVEVAKSVFRMVKARVDLFRKEPKQYGSGAFGKTYGPDMKLFEELLPFYTACEKDPRLQAEALESKGEIAQYVVSSCFFRSFFSEDHHGANDCYDTDHNLAVNFWRGARVVDSPYAWDCAVCLYDNHYRITVGAGEGLGADGVFTFHNANGRHIHMSGYGMNWYVKIGIDHKRNGTPWAMTPEQYRRCVDWVCAYEWFVYQDHSTFVANGRHNHRQGLSSWVSDYAQMLLNLPDGALYPADRERLLALQQRVKQNPKNTIVGNRFFYRNLYMVQRRSGYFIDVKMISPLVGGPETFAGAIPWNIGYGDGVTSLMKDAKEYEQIHRGLDNAAYAFGWRKVKEAPKDLALWHYRAIGGTTQLDHELRGPDRYRGGSGQTAGGVSDGDLGHCAFQYRNGNTATACNKFYGFTNDGMAVLVTDLNATYPDKEILPDGVEYRTNLHQCDWTDAVKVRAEDGKEWKFDVATEGADLRLPLTQRYWVEHRGIGYLLLPTGGELGGGKPGEFRLQLSERSPVSPMPGFAVSAEAEAMIGKAGLNQTRKAKVMQLSIMHGKKPQGGKAAYWVCMMPESLDIAQLLKSPPVSVLANEESMQAVRDLRDGTVHAFFRQAGELLGLQKEPLLAVDRPASVMWRPSRQELTVQDPVAACTSDIAKMANKIQVKLGSGLLEKERLEDVPMKGVEHPDDRYRGEPVVIKIHEAKAR